MQINRPDRQASGMPPAMSMRKNLHVELIESQKRTTKNRGTLVSAHGTEDQRRTSTPISGRKYLPSLPVNGQIPPLGRQWYGYKGDRGIKSWYEHSHERSPP